MTPRRRRPVRHCIGATVEGPARDRDEFGDGARDAGFGGRFGDRREFTAFAVAGEDARCRLDGVGIDIGVEHQCLLLDDTVAEHGHDEHDTRLERHEVHGPHPHDLVLGADDHGGVAGHPSQQVARVVEQVVEEPGRRAEELGDLALLGVGQVGQRGGVVDEVAVPTIGGNTARRGVRLHDVALAFERPHLVAHGGGRDVEALARHDGARRDRLCGRDVLLDDGTQDAGLALVESVGRAVRVVIHGRGAGPTGLALNRTECQRRRRPEPCRHPAPPSGRSRRWRGADRIGSA